MIKIRTTNPPARMANGSVSHGATARHQNISPHSSAYPPNVFAICQSARTNDGC